MSRATMLCLIAASSLSFLTLAWHGWADNPSAATSRATVESLKDFQGLIGEWRGIGQPRRGSRQGTWQETAEGVWKLTGPAPGISWQVEEGKLWKSFRLVPGDNDQPFVIDMQVDDDQLRRYSGKMIDDRLVVESLPDDAGEVYRLTLTWLNADRCLLLSEKRQSTQSFHQRIAEVAYQRQGTKLAAKDGSGPECIVTGGLGTIAVSHEGKTYYVCCTGCRDAFNDDPAGILAEWQARKNKASAPASQPQ